MDIENQHLDIATMNRRADSDDSHDSQDNPILVPTSGAPLPGGSRGIGPELRSPSGDQEIYDPEHLEILREALAEAQSKNEDTTLYEDDIRLYQNRFAKTRAAPVPAGAGNVISPTMRKLILINQALAQEVKRTPSCIDPKADEKSYVTEAASNLATKAEDKLGDMMFENELQPDEQAQWDQAKALVTTILAVKGAKKRDSSIRMPSMDLSSYMWSGKPADLSNYLQRIETLLRPYDKEARFNYLYQSLRPRDRPLIEHTVKYDEAIAILSKLTVNASAELEELYIQVMKMPVAQSEEAQLDTIQDILVALHKGLQLDPKWFISIHSGSMILRTLHNEVDINNATTALTKQYNDLPRQLDEGSQAQGSGQHRRASD